MTLGGHEREGVVSRSYEFLIKEHDDPTMNPWLELMIGTLFI